MTYEELLALINPQNAYTYDQQIGGGSEGYMSVPTTVPNAYLMDPSNPAAGYVWDGGDGSLQSVIPRASGGQDWTQYAPGGAVTGTGFSQDTSKWYDSLLRAGAVLGGPALAMNVLPGLLAGSAAPAATAAPVAGSSMSPSIGAAVAGAGAAETLPAVAGGLGAGSGVAGAIEGMMSAAPGAAATAATAPTWASMLGSGASSLLSNPALLAAGAGALAGVAGNSDMTNTSTTSTSLAPWLQGAAQDFVGRAGQLASGPASNATMDQGRGLLSNIATQGDPLVNAARGQQANVIGGGMLNSNPYLDQVAGNVGRRMGDAYAVGTRAGQMGAASQSGNWDSAGAQEALGLQDRSFADSVGSTMSNLYMGNYNQERAAQDNASRSSLGFGNFAAGNAQNLYGVGQQDWQRPYFQNQQFGAAINPAFGSQATQQQTINAPNNWMAGMGGAALGAGLYRSIFPPAR